MRSDRRELAAALSVPVVVALVALAIAGRGNAAAGREVASFDDRLPVGAPEWHRASGAAAGPVRGGARAPEELPAAAPARVGEVIRGDAIDVTGSAAGALEGDMVGEAFGTLEIASYGDGYDDDDYAAYGRGHDGSYRRRWLSGWYSRYRRVGQPAYWFLQPMSGGSSVTMQGLSAMGDPTLGGGGGGSYAASVASGGARGASDGAATPAPATLRRTAEGRWILFNGLAEVVIDPTALCAMRVRTARAPASAPLAALRFLTPEGDAGCAVTPRGDTGGLRAAVLIAWRGADWAQRVELSLAAGAAAPEAVVRLTRAAPAADAPRASDAPQHVTYVANLTEREIALPAGASVAPGAVGRTELPADGDADGT